jgi:tetratricopeptide (TPR) repeat protein
VNRDNVLFAMAGLVVGFIAAYFVFEVVAQRQPARLTAGAAVATEPDPAASAPGGGARAPFLEQMAELERFVEAHPDDADAARQLGNAYFDAENWKGAADAYQHYLTLRDPDPDLLTDLGVSLLRQGGAQEALGRFREAEKLDANHWQSRYNEVVVLTFELKRYDEAAKALEVLRKLQPTNPDVDRLAAAVAEHKKAA